MEDGTLAVEMPCGFGERRPGEIRTMPRVCLVLPGPFHLHDGGEGFRNLPFMCVSIMHLSIVKAQGLGHSVLAAGQIEKPWKGSCTLERFSTYHPVSPQRDIKSQPCGNTCL